MLYKSSGDDLAKAAGVENPVTKMAEAVSRVFATPEAKAADAAKPAPAAAASATAPAVPTGATGGPNHGLLIGGVILVLAIGLGAAIFLGERKKKNA